MNDKVEASPHQGQIYNGMNNKQKAFGSGSIVLAITGLLWFVVCFSAPKAGWWNSLWFFLAIFLISISLGIIGHKTKRGITGIVVGSLGFLGVAFLLYIR
jgi:hypothetical protein